mgnify:CR=1 FL=1
MLNTNSCVVLITTKKGKKGEKVTFNYNNNFSWSAPSRMAKGLPADQWLRAMNVESNNTSGTQYWSDELIAAVEERMKDPSLPTAWENTQGNKFTANGEWLMPVTQTGWMYCLMMQPSCNSTTPVFVAVLKRLLLWFSRL